MNTHEKYQNIFNTDFFPTPTSVLDKMDIDASRKMVLEPSAGKGDIIDFLDQQGATSISFCEINRDLAEICKTKANFLQYDFFNLNKEDVAHIELIVMNPPFSEFRKHFSHAWNIAPDGCQIICLANADSVGKSYYKEQEEINTIIEDYGRTSHLGDCFNDELSERKTNVSIVCITVFKPMDIDATTFDGFHFGFDEETIQKNGVVKFNEIQSVINSYISSLREFKNLDECKNVLNNCLKPIDEYSSVTLKINYNSSAISLHEFQKTLLKRCWRIVFSMTGISKYLTSDVMKDVDVYIEKQSYMPFTMKNIYRMVEILFGTREHNLKRALVKTIDKFTMHTHENRYNVEGWKTNAGHLLNKKFIVDNVFEVKEYGRNKGKLNTTYSSYSLNLLDDLILVLNNLTGNSFTTSLKTFVDNFDGLESGRWYSFSYFEFKGFKKGTMHLKFQNEKDWELLNRKYGEAKGIVLPEKI